ncbi:hypothetical protein [Amycolatopsis sp. NPDC051128]|uniref:hypothetical protein n=1 Tax=Amycolatopsis sp. NPDC051128 TaxID=3155412 RepID=UPI00342A5949
MNRLAIFRVLSRQALIVAAVAAGILNGSVLAAPILIFMVYLLCVLVRLGRQAETLYWDERYRRATDRRALTPQPRT